MFLQNSIAMEHSHKAGSLKQSNKSHKQVKNSKRATKLSMGGRVEGGGRLSIKEKWEEVRCDDWLERRVARIV